MGKGGLGVQGGWSLLQITTLMNNFQADDYHIWRIKLQLATEGSLQAIEEIRAQLALHTSPQHSIMQANMVQLLTDSTIHLLQKGQVHARCDIYSSVPSCILLMGKAVIRCMNGEGDNDTVCEVEKGGLLEVDATQLLLKYGEGKATLLTQFQIVAEEKTILIELSRKAVEAASVRNGEEITLREQAIMRKYMLIALKHITKFTYSKGMTINTKFYLLNGKACYYNRKTKTILACYEQGFFSPYFLKDSEISLFIFEGAYLMQMQEDMLKDEVITGLEFKRKAHLQAVQQKYDKMTVQQRSKCQQQLIKKYSLNRKEIQKDILCLPRSQPLKKQKTDSTRTSSSLKDKSNIRIRKSQKSK